MSHLRSRRKPIPSTSYQNCLAKSSEDGRPGMTVLEHCRIVGAVATALLQRLPVGVCRLLPDGIAALAAMHDLGKVSPGFQLKYFRDHHRQFCPDLAAKALECFETKHAVISESSLLSWLGSQGLLELLDGWAKVLGAHHGTHNELPKQDGACVYGGLNWQQQRRDLLAKLVEEYGTIPTAVPTGEHLLMATGLTCIADWIASDERWFSPGGLPKNAPLGELAEQALDEAGWIWPTVRARLSFADLFGGDYQPNSMQQAVYQAAMQPGVYVVEAPTGLGKTEAALWGAYRLLESGHNNGLYFALPTRLTSNHIHLRINEFLKRAFDGDPRARLLHSQAWMQLPKYGGEELRPGGTWFTPAKRGLLLPFAVGTIDQALLSVINVRHSFMRAFGLAGKVVVLDEVHSYDMYTGTLLDELVRMLLRLGCTVFILSATLTRRRRQAFLANSNDRNDAYPLISFQHPQGKTKTLKAKFHASRTVNIQTRSNQPFEIAEAVAERIRQGNAVLWIMNTVNAAQACYRAAKAAAVEGDLVGLLHSRFPAWRREELEEEWMSRLGKHAPRDRGAVLVATQVVEQSVDIDADFLVTELAPTDMLLQRMGRLWRHDRTGRAADTPITWLVADDISEVRTADEFKNCMGATAYVYSPYVLWRSREVWCRKCSVTLPDETRRLLESTYTDPIQGDPPWARELFDEFQKHRNQLRDLAIASTEGSLPTLHDEEDACTRYDTGKRFSVLLVREADFAAAHPTLTLADGTELTIKNNQVDYAVARAVHRNLVSLRQNRQSASFVQAGIPRWLKTMVRDIDCVLMIAEDGRLIHLDGQPTPLGYDDSLGVFLFPVSTQHDEEVPYSHEFDW